MLSLLTLTVWRLRFVLCWPPAHLLGLRRGRP
jgi:hypothetical protein